MSRAPGGQARGPPLEEQRVFVRTLPEELASAAARLGVEQADAGSFRRSIELQ